MRQVQSPADVPKGHHYAVIRYDTRSIYHEGDERSRTHPGHGYPAHTETVSEISHYVTESKEEWEAFINKNLKQLDKMVCLEVASKAEVKVTTVVTTTIK